MLVAVSWPAVRRALSMAVLLTKSPESFSDGERGGEDRFDHRGRWRRDRWRFW